MSALGSCGCVVFYAICMAFEGWSVSLLICARKAVGFSSSSNASVRRWVIAQKYLPPSRVYCLHANEGEVVRWCHLVLDTIRDTLPFHPPPSWS